MASGSSAPQHRTIKGSGAGDSEQREPGLAGLYWLLLIIHPLSVAESRQGMDTGLAGRCCAPRGFNQQLRSPPAPWGVPRCPHNPEQTPKLGATTPWIPAFHGAYFRPQRANVFFCPLFADLEQRSSGSGKHEEPGAKIAQEMAKETMGNKDTAPSPGRSRGRRGQGARGSSLTRHLMHHLAIFPTDTCCAQR